MEIEKKVKVIPTAKVLGEMARSLTVQAMETLEEIISDQTNHPSARLKAVEIILDRGFGKVQPVAEQPQSLDPAAIDKAIGDLVKKAPQLIRKKLAEVSPEKVAIDDE